MVEIEETKLIRIKSLTSQVSTKIIEQSMKFSPYLTAEDKAISKYFSVKIA